MNPESKAIFSVNSSRVTALERAVGVARALKTLSRYLGLARQGRRWPIVEAAGLREFIDSRASHVSQSALYGYLKTRSGTRFPQLFENREYLRSINIAKWRVWLACVSDLSVYAGALIERRAGVPGERVGELMEAVVDEILVTPIIEETDPDFADGVSRTRVRVRNTDWSAAADDESSFVESPAALVRWAPVVDEFKERDAEIIENSVRFRWIEVRRVLRENLDAPALFAPRRS